MAQKGGGERERPEEDENIVKGGREVAGQAGIKAEIRVSHLS